MKMFASKAAKSKLLAFGVVAMFVLCAVSCVADADAAGPYGGITDNSSDSKDQKYAIDISTKQTFTYSDISTSLSGYGTTTFDWKLTKSGVDSTAITKTDLDGGKTSLSGKFEDAGTYVGVLTATWNPATADTGITQTAKQTLTFNVVEAVDIENGASSVTFSALTTLGGKAFTKTINYTGGTGDANTKMLLNDSEVTTVDGIPFTFSHDVTNKSITITADSNLTGKKGTYEVNLTIKNDKSGDSDTVPVTIYVFDKIEITPESAHYYAYEGQTDGTWKDGIFFEISYENDDDDKTTYDSPVIEFGPSDMTDTEKKIITKGGDYTDATTSKKLLKFNVDVSSSDVGFDSKSEKGGSVIGVNNNERTYTVKVSVTGKIGDNTQADYTNTDSAEVELTVYKALVFTKAPTTSNITAAAVSPGSNSITLSSYISGAKSVKFDWNDGSTTESVVTGTAANYSVNHTYAKAGVYLITISATNDMGTTTSKVMYSVGQDSTVTPDTTTDTDDTKKDTGFFEKHGFLFIVFLILAALLVYAAFFMGYQIPPVLIAIPICVVLAVLLFCYKDFGGIIDAIKGIR